MVCSQSQNVLTKTINKYVSYCYCTLKHYKNFTLFKNTVYHSTTVITGLYITPSILNKLIKFSVVAVIRDNNVTIICRIKKSITFLIERCV